MGENVLDLYEGPVQIFRSDDQGRGEADNVVVCFLTEEAGGSQGLAITPCAPGFGIKLDADQQAFAPDFLDPAALPPGKKRPLRSNENRCFRIRNR